MRAAAAVTRHDSVVGPADGLLVDELHGRVGLGLQYWLANCNGRGPGLFSQHAHLEIKVGLLKAGTRHGLLPGTLTPGPDSLPVWRLGQLYRHLALGLWHGGLCRGRGRHRLGV